MPPLNNLDRNNFSLSTPDEPWDRLPLPLDPRPLSPSQPPCSPISPNPLPPYRPPSPAIPLNLSNRSPPPSPPPAPNYSLRARSRSPLSSPPTLHLPNPPQSTPPSVTVSSLNLTILLGSIPLVPEPFEPSLLPFPEVRHCEICSTIPQVVSFLNYSYSIPTLKML